MHIHACWFQRCHRSRLHYWTRTLPRLLYQALIVDPFFFKSCARVVTGSDFHSRLLRRFYGIQTDRLAIIHNWIDTRFFCPNSSAGRQERQALGIEKDELVIL